MYVSEALSQSRQSFVITVVVSNRYSWMRVSAASDLSWLQTPILRSLCYVTWWHSLASDRISIHQHCLKTIMQHINSANTPDSSNMQNWQKIRWIVLIMINPFNLKLLMCFICHHSWYLYFIQGKTTTKQNFHLFRFIATKKCTMPRREKKSPQN